MIKHLFFSIFSVFFCLIALFPQSAKSFELSDFHRRVNAEVIEQKFKETDRTFWNFGQLNRFHFAPNNTFSFQFIDKRVNMPLGSVVNGTWFLKSNELCLKYSSEDAQTYHLKSDVKCYKIFIIKDVKEKDFLSSHTQNIYLVGDRNDAGLPEVITFSSWIAGDYIFAPQLAPSIQKSYDIMRHLLKSYKGRIPEATTDPQNLPPIMQKYYNMVVDRVFTIDGRFYSYFHPSGRYFWVSADDIKKSQGDMNSLIKLTKEGSWSMKDHFHCWESGKNGASCEYIFDKKQGLLHPHSRGILTLHDSGRVGEHLSNQGYIRHMDIQDTPMANLFLYFKAKAEK